MRSSALAAGVALAAVGAALNVAMLMTLARAVVRISREAPSYS
jgi:hypothetical protein